MHKRIVRRGNHFIQIDGAGWVLIDGPWFEHLEAYRKPPKHCYAVQLPYFPNDHKIDWRGEPDPLDIIEYKVTTWEPIKWHPGKSSFVLFPWKGLGLSYFTIHLLELKWDELIAKRTRTGWRISPDGRLPAFLHRVDLSDDDWMNEQWMRKDR